MLSTEQASAAPLPAFELLDPEELSALTGGFVPVPPLLLAVSTAGSGVMLLGVAAGAAFYLYTRR